MYDLDFCMEMVEQDIVCEIGNTVKGKNTLGKLAARAYNRTTTDGTPEQNRKAARAAHVFDRSADILVDHDNVYKDYKKGSTEVPKTSKKTSEPTHPIVTPASEKKQGMSWKKKAAIAAGVGAAGYGAYRYLKNK